MQEAKRRLRTLVVGALFTAACTSPPDPSAPTLAIRNTSVFDTHTGSFVSGQTVLIRGDRIVSLDPAEEVEVSPATEVLDGEGKFLIPGLIDAHVHLTHVLYQAGITADQILPYFLANGVTTVRSTGDNVVAQSLLRRWANEHPGLSPRLFLGSWLIGNAPPIHKDIGWSLTSPDDVPAFVNHMSKWGVTTLKIYANCLPEVARKVIEEGRKQGLVVAGYLRSYPVEDAVAHGIDSLEHIESVSDFLRADPKDRHSLDIESDKARQLVRTIADSGVFVDPTLTVFWGTLFFVDVDEVVNHPDNLEMPRRLQDFWAVDRKRRLTGYAAGPLGTRRATFRKYQDLVGMLHEAGAKILVGTDAPEPQVPPGYSLHQEMEFLVESGMSPAAVLQAATQVNAEVLREENDLGSIEPGKRADLVLLRANPLDDIRNTRKIERVINLGRALCRPRSSQKPSPHRQGSGPARTLTLLRELPGSTQMGRWGDRRSMGNSNRETTLGDPLEDSIPAGEPPSAVAAAVHKQGIVARHNGEGSMAARRGQIELPKVLRPSRESGQNRVLSGNRRLVRSRRRQRTRFHAIYLESMACSRIRICYCTLRRSKTRTNPIDRKQGRTQSHLRPQPEIAQVPGRESLNRPATTPWRGVRRLAVASGADMCNYSVWCIFMHPRSAVMPTALRTTQPIPSIAAADLLTDLDLTAGELTALIELASRVKAAPADYAEALNGRSIALLFEKPSLRTRMTFELAIQQLGGHAIFQDHRDGRIGEREPAKDIARNLDRWVHAIVARVFAQQTLEDLAQWSSVPVINALSGEYHPCQAMADFQTLHERFGTLEDLKMAFVGDGNNVCHSLMLCAARLGVSTAVATPEGYAPRPEIVAQAIEFAAETGAAVEVTHDAQAAVADAAAIYTDAWTSMGWEAETQQRRVAFAAFQVNEALMATARGDAIFMHCLPASRGEEVTDAVMESGASAVFDQAENRLHAQKALLLMLLAHR